MLWVVQQWSPLARKSKISITLGVTGLDVSGALQYILSLDVGSNISEKNDLPRDSEVKNKCFLLPNYIDCQKEVWSRYKVSFPTTNDPIKKNPSEVYLDAWVPKNVYASICTLLKVYIFLQSIGPMMPCLVTSLEYNIG